MLFIQNVTNLFKNVFKLSQFGENSLPQIENTENLSDAPPPMDEISVYDGDAVKSCMKENEAQELWDKRNEDVVLQWEEDTDGDGCIDQFGTLSDTDGDGLLTGKDDSENIVKYK